MRRYFLYCRGETRVAIVMCSSVPRAENDMDLHDKGLPFLALMCYQPTLALILWTSCSLNSHCHRSHSQQRWTLHWITALWAYIEVKKNYSGRIQPCWMSQRKRKKKNIHMQLYLRVTIFALKRHASHFSKQQMLRTIFDNNYYILLNMCGSDLPRRSKRRWLVCTCIWRHPGPASRTSANSC